MSNFTMQRRKMFNETPATLTRVMGENSVEIINAKSSKLISLFINVMETTDAEERKIIFRGKNLFNPAREFQSNQSYLGNIENLKAGIEAGQMLFYGLSCGVSEGATFTCSTPNQYWIICPVTNGLSYVTRYLKSKLILLDENLVVVKVSDTRTILNDVDAKYLAYYCFNIAQSTSVQTWTLDDVKTKCQIEVGTELTDYTPYVEPQIVIVPKYVNYDDTGVELRLTIGEGLDVNYQSGIVKYNGEVLPTEADFCQSVLGLSCPSAHTFVETEGISSMITAIYYC